MNFQSQIAKQFRAVYFGGNWTYVSFKEKLDGLTWQQATAKVHSFNTIAVLVYHINYYVEAVTKVLQGGTLDAHDKYSFGCPPIESQEDWERLVNKIFTNAENFALLIEQIPDAKFEEIFINEKYGNYYRNIHGIIEHNHYHLGQISLIRKLLLEENKS